MTKRENVRNGVINIFFQVLGKLSNFLIIIS